MNKFFDYLKNSFIPIFLCLNILYIIIMNILSTLNSNYFVIYGHSLIGLSITCLFISIFLLFKKRNFKLIDILLLLMIFCAFISTLFAYDFEVAIFGIDGRYEGVFAIIYYLLLFYLSSFVDMQKKSIIIRFILLFGFVNVLFAFFEITGIIRRSNGFIMWACGIASNPNFYGSVMVMVLSYVIGLFIDCDDIIEKVLYFFLLIIFLFGLLVSNTMSAVVGMIAVLLIVFVYVIINKKYKDFAIIFGVLFFVSISLYNMDRTKLIKDFLTTSHEVVEIGKGNINEDFGTKRIKVWKETLKVVPKYLVHGIGIDNYYFIFDGRPLTIGKFFYDKAHNEYLQILVTEGIFCLICYLVFYFIICMDGLINSFKDKKIYLLLPVVGYLVQAFFNISVIEVAPIFYIALGLLVDRDKVYLNKELKR